MGILRERLFDRRLGWLAVALSPVAVVLAAEQLGLSERIVEVVTEFGFPLWAVWLVLLAASLLRTDPADGAGPQLTWRAITAGAVLYALGVAPVLLG